MRWMRFSNSFDIIALLNIRNNWNNNCSNDNATEHDTSIDLHKCCRCLESDSFLKYYDFRKSRQTKRLPVIVFEEYDNA